MIHIFNLARNADQIWDVMTHEQIDKRLVGRLHTITLVSVCVLDFLASIYQLAGEPAFLFFRQCEIFDRISLLILGIRVSQTAETKKTTRLNAISSVALLFSFFLPQMAVLYYIASTADLVVRCTWLYDRKGNMEQLA